MSVVDLVKQHIPELKKESSRSWAGPCPKCGGEDRFVVGGQKDIFSCRGCGAAGGEVSFLRLLGRSCPEAHEELGLACQSTTCPADRCRVRGGSGARPVRQARRLQTPPASRAPEFTPAAAATPEQLWQTKAAELIDHTHRQLLDNPEQLAYLAGRGLPREAVENYRLGWLAENRYRPRKAWGLPEALWENGKPKKLGFPAGIVIPFFDAQGQPLRLRIRRARVTKGQQRYYWVPGSGNDVPIIGDAAARAFVVVESDLDGLMVHHWAGDLVGAIPLGTVSAKPKEAAAAALSQALAILVAIDLDAAGGKAHRWWLEHYPQSKRWPVPAGKDPGEYYETHRGNVRSWVLAGLPPVFHVGGGVEPCPAADPAPRTDPGVPDATPPPGSREAALQRLSASDIRARNGGASWRRTLARADSQVREAWALLAAGAEANGGMAAAVADYWAWDELQESMREAVR